MTEEKVQTKYELGPNERYVMAKVPRQLDKSALEACADESDALTSKIERLEEDAREASKDFRKQIKSAKADRRTLVEERRSKKRLTEMQCVETTNFPTSRVVTFPYPGHPNAIRVSELPLSADELREPPLFAGAGGKAAAAAGKGKGKKTKKPKPDGGPAAPPPEEEAAGAGSHH